MPIVEPERTAILARVRYELGYSALGTAGEPHFTIVYAPDKAIDSLLTGAETTTCSPVTSTTSPTTLVLDSATGFASGMRVHIDTGAQREIVTAQAVHSGTNELIARFAKTHCDQVPVEVDSGCSMLRTVIYKLQVLQDLLTENASVAGIRKVDEIEFFGAGAGVGARGVTRLTELYDERSRWRDELASLLKLPNLHNRKQGGRLEAY